DFALIELYGSLIGQPNIALSGWNRANTIPSSTTLIHHPAGDAKKISFDYDPPQQTTLNGRELWLLQTDLGTVEGGSSGAPWFDQNRRIIGTHLGHDDVDLSPCELVNMVNIYS